MSRQRRLSRYLLSELATATLLGIVLWTAILLMNDFFFIARQAIEKDLGLGTTFQLVLFKIPNLLILAIPIGTLLGSMVAVGRLSADGEITALQAAGLGPRQLVRPLAIHGLLAFFVSFAIYSFAQPWASYELRMMQGKILTARNVSTELHPRVFFDKLPGYVLFIDDIPPGTKGVLDRTVLYQTPPPQSGKSGVTEQLIVAKSATLGPAAGSTGALRMVFHDGVAHSYRNDDPETYRSVQFDVYSPDPIELPPWMRADPTSLPKTVTDMPTRELWQELRQAPKEPDRFLRGFRVRAAQGEVHRRFALPFASFLFAVLALPLGVSRARSGKGAGFAVSLGVILIYYLVFRIGSNQAYEGRLPITLGLWGANILIAVWAAIAYARFGGVAGGRSLGEILMATIRPVLARLPRRRVRSAAVAGTPESLRISAVLDRYIGSTYLRMLALTLAATYLIFSLIELNGLLDGVIERKQSFIVILEYFRYFIPGALVFTLPFATMIAAVVTITLLARSGEITALKASGMSARRICLPIVGLTVVLCGMLYLVQDRIAPETNRKRAAVKDRIEGRNPRTYGLVPGGRWTFGSDGRLYHYQLFDPQNLRFQGLSVFQIDLARARILEQWFCSAASWKDGAWQAERGWYRSFPEPGAAGDYRRFTTESISTFDLPANFTRSEHSLAAGGDLAEQVSSRELAEQIDQLAANGYDTTRLQVDYWVKTATATNPLVTVLVALPFAFKVGRRGSMYGVGAGLILAIVFWATAAIFNALGQDAILPPFLAAWTPNIMYAALGVYLLLFIPT